MDIILCDDDPVFGKKIKKYLSSRLRDGYNIRLFNKYRGEMQDYICMDRDPAIFILDIELNEDDIDGYIIAKKIRSAGIGADEIIFLTINENPSKKAINEKLNAAGFYTKNIDSNKEIIEAVLYAQKRIEFSGWDKNTRRVEIIINYKKCFIPEDEIVYIEISGDRKVDMHVIKNNVMTVYTVGGSLKSVLYKLGNDFYRISRTLAVNKKYIVSSVPGDGLVTILGGEVKRGNPGDIRRMLI